MTDAEIEKRIAQVNATMALEGMPLTKKDKNLLREISIGNISYENALKKAIMMFKKEKSYNG